MKQSTLALDTTRQRRADNEHSRQALEEKAWHSYEQSLSNRVSNEHSVQFRADARDCAHQLLRFSENHLGALNLLGRIALDEGFYDTAERHLNQALTLNKADAGSWYSLGHVHLARAEYDKAMTCFTTSLDLSPGETRAATSLVYTFARQGNVVQAFNGYRQLYRVHPNDNHIKAKLFDVARHIQADSWQPELERDLIEWLRLDDVDHDGLAPLVASLLTHKYQIDDPDAVIDLQDLASDVLLNLSLSRLYFTSATLESFLIQVRKQVLLNSLACQFQDSALLKLASSFMMQASHNEHVYRQDDEECALVEALQDLLQSTLATGKARPTDLLNPLLMYGMYEPVHRLNGATDMADIALNRWPAYARPVIRHCLVSIQQELTVARSLAALTPVHDTVSRKVQQQYEEHPYPRWLHLNYNTPTNYGRALEAELEGYRAPQFFNMGTIRILIAGAGTGRHALHVARYFRNVEVTAIDLSRRSLAYAQQMAERYRVHNVRFLQADILELERFEQGFHVIECSGVLHHMANPEAGLASLKQQLEPNGLLKIGLYSEAARRVVVEARQWIERLGYEPSQKDIRRFRAALMDGRLDGDFSALLSSRDFYSASGCRDLLFHVQEHRFTPGQLAQMLERHRLDFLGFVTAPTVRQAFRNYHGEAANLRDLNQWHAFEQQAPDTFAGMYQLYTQVRS
ncbi:MAG: class I SAM-dependent methyltransferase [Saccharospirillum sp.]